MTTNPELKKAISEYKARLEAAARKQSALAAKMEKDSVDFQQIVSRAVKGVVDENLMGFEIKDKQLSGPDGITLTLKVLHIQVFEKKLLLEPDTSSGQVAYPLSALEGAVSGHIARKEDQVWKVFSLSDGTYVGHFNEEYVAEHLIHLVNSW